MRHILVFFAVLLLSPFKGHVQTAKNTPSSEIFQSLQKLNFLGSVLYVAAHPDDENTRLISYFANEKKARTAYLSLTRGDGGQNMIGPELRELLGVLRTQELLAARRIDGGEQIFSRANDFGYSKHPKETLKIWNENQVLADVVWAIRNFKPDVIINRFDHRTPGTTHGHHTSSALLSVEAFDLTGDPKEYPEQLTYTETWQPKRLFFNTFWWFYGSRENFEKADKSKMLTADIGTYYPVLGVSNNEIASRSRSQHRSQGFGTLSVRGSENEYLELIKGTLPKDKTNIFEGVDTSWSRLEGGAAIGAILTQVEKTFNFMDPAEHIDELLQAYELIKELKDDHWREIKSKEIKKLILDVTGLYLEASAAESYTNPGESVEIGIEAINRSKVDVVLKSVLLSGKMTDEKDIALKENQKFNLTLNLEVPKNTAYTSPYWLNKKGSLGMYSVEKQEWIGKPETPKPFEAQFVLDFNGNSISFKKPVVHRYSERDKGELYRPFEILPKATARFDDKVLIFANAEPKKIPITVKAHADSVEGKVQLCFSKGWTVEQEIKSFKIAKKGDEQTLIFSMIPPSYEDESYITPLVKINGSEISKELITISYDHIPTQSVLLPSEAKVVRLNIQKTGENIGYIMGAGDKVPESLEQIGYTVHLVDPKDITPENLKKFDALVVGIRAYNVVDELKFKQRYLLDYAKNGGNLIVQYNTSGRWDSQFPNIAPYPITLSRDRVTDENSNVEILAKNHPLVNFPNTITNDDFKGWVQERGLYFPNKWSGEFTPILSMNDQGEPKTNGSLIVAPYGKGHYIYTGLSFFRELPAGVPGAYKLFSNMLSLGKEKIDTDTQVKG
ncbi:PIG-L family deacetylase [Ulvibacterium marinum]|uniref:PIG-L family deacetylase n=1 Tax=Ulvibacterium marinum TaxID=2419782 RepID=UPI0024953045|nr:PIG-L family deacetylase [Ulvibacterium marinum]